MASERQATARAAAPVRRRLAPEERVEEILNFAGQLIMESGLTEISMEGLARDAGVSKALIYNYFPNLTDLLRALLEREIVQLREKGIAVIATCTDFPDLIRKTTRMYIEHIATRGTLLQRLWQEPSVARAVADKNVHSTDEAMRYFVKQVRKEYGLPLQVAIAAVGMQMSMTETAAQHLGDAGNNIDLATDICVRLLLGGLDGLAAHYRSEAPKATAARGARAKPAPAPAPAAARKRASAGKK